MLFQFILFIILLLSLFFLSTPINTSIYQIVFILTRSKKLSLGVLIIILLPGTLIHELSHFLIATLLFVPSGELTIFPKMEEGRIKAGSIKHNSTDPLRRSVIGIAPMIIGLSLIYVVGNLFLSQIINSPASPAGGQLSITNLFFILNSKFFILFSTFYLLFVTSITMFSSKKDLEIAWVFIPLVLLLIFILYLNGLRFRFPNNLLNIFTSFFHNLDIYLFITFLLDLIIFLLLKGMVLSLQKMLKVKLVTI